MGNWVYLTVKPHCVESDYGCNQILHHGHKIDLCPQPTLVLNTLHSPTIRQITTLDGLKTPDGCRKYGQTALPRSRHRQTTRFLPATLRIIALRTLP